MRKYPVFGNFRFDVKIYIKYEGNYGGNYVLVELTGLLWIK